MRNIFSGPARYSNYSGGNSCEINDSRNVRDRSIITVGALTTLMVLGIWILLLNIVDLDMLAKTSDKFKDLDNDMVQITALMGSLLVSVILSLVFYRYPRLFLALFAASFIFSGSALGGVSAFFFFVRYISSSLLIIYGSLCIYRKKIRLTLVQTVGVIFLVWCIVNLLLNGADAISGAALFLWVTLMVGVMIGLQYRLATISVKDMCAAVGWLCVPATIVHLASFALYGKPFVQGRFTSIFYLPTNFADSYVLLCIPLLWLALHTKNRKSLFILWSFCLIGLVLLGLSGTRNAAISFAVALVAMAYIWRTKLLVALFTGFLIVAAASLYFSQHLENKETVFTRTNGEQSMEGRESVWHNSWNYIKDRPVQGYGLGKGMITINQDIPKWEWLNSHNAYLGLWLEVGIIGLSLIVLLYLLSLAAGFAAFMGSGIAEKRVVILPIIFLLVLLVGGFVEENLTGRGSAQQFFWAFAVMLLDRITSKRRVGIAGQFSRGWCDS